MDRSGGGGAAVRCGGIYLTAVVCGGADRSAMWDQDRKIVAVQGGGGDGGGDFVEGAVLREKGKL